jgi:hypothetical protein
MIISLERQKNHTTDTYTDSFDSVVFASQEEQKLLSLYFFRFENVSMNLLNPLRIAAHLPLRF